MLGYQRKTNTLARAYGGERIIVIQILARRRHSFHKFLAMVVGIDENFPKQPFRDVLRGHDLQDAACSCRESHGVDR